MPSRSGSAHSAGFSCTRRRRANSGISGITSSSAGQLFTSPSGQGSVRGRNPMTPQENRFFIGNAGGADRGLQCHTRGHVRRWPRNGERLRWRMDSLAVADALEPQKARRAEDAGLRAAAQRKQRHESYRVAHAIREAVRASARRAPEPGRVICHPQERLSAALSVAVIMSCSRCHPNGDLSRLRPRCSEPGTVEPAAAALSAASQPRAEAWPGSSRR